MLGDNPEKSKNPLKKAMRRRNTKTVTFTSPTYFEASDIEYSTDEEQGEGEYLGDEDETSRGETQDLQDETHNENIVVEPLRPRQHKRAGESETPQEREDLDRGSPEKSRTSEETSDGQGKLLFLLGRYFADFRSSGKYGQQVQKWNRAGFLL